MLLTVIPAQAGIQYGQGQADAIKAGNLYTGFRRYDGDSPAILYKCSFNLIKSQGGMSVFLLTVIPAQAGIQYGQGQADAIKAGNLYTGFRRYDGDSPANPW